MKNTILAVLALFTLSGCGDMFAFGRYAGGNCSDSTGSAVICTDRVSPKYGVRYRVDTPVAGFNYGSRIDTTLEYMAACLGVAPDVGDFVIVITTDIDRPAHGKTYASIGLIVVDSDARGFFSTMEHEFVHALYYVNYGNDDHAHASGCYPSGTVL